MKPTRWERVLDSKPVPIVDHLIREVAKLFAQDLKGWPPDIEELDAAQAPTFQTLLKETKVAPSGLVFREAFKLTRLDLSREMDAYDDYFRNQRWLEVGLVQGDKAMLLFLSRFMVEQLLAFQEFTQGRIKRTQLLEVLEYTEANFFMPAGVLPS